MRCGSYRGGAPRPPLDVSAARLGSAPKTAPGDADGSPRNSGAPWWRATPPTTAPARPAFAGVSDPRLPPPAARSEATGAPHATVPGEHRGSREVSGEQHGRQRCRSNRWAVRVALTCPCTSSASYKRILLGRPVRVKGAGYNCAAHNRRKHSSDQLPGECIDGHVGSNNGPQAVTKGGDRYTDLSEGARGSADGVDEESMLTTAARTSGHVPDAAASQVEGDLGTDDTALLNCRTL